MIYRLIYNRLNSEITKVLQQMEFGKSESSQTDKNDNINIIADDNESNSKGNPSIISDYNIFNGASNNYNNILTSEMFIIIN